MEPEALMWQILSTAISRINNKLQEAAILLAATTFGLSFLLTVWLNRKTEPALAEFSMAAMAFGLVALASFVVAVFSLRQADREVRRALPQLLLRRYAERIQYVAAVYQTAEEGISDGTTANLVGLVAFLVAAGLGTVASWLLLVSP